MVVPAQVLGDVAGAGRELLEVLADAEAAARPRDHDGADRRIGGRLAERVAQARVHRGVQRIEHVRAVQRDREDATVPLELDLGHSTNHNEGIGRRPGGPGAGSGVQSRTMTNPYSAFPSLDLDRPAAGVLRLTLRAPGRLNAVSGAMHGELGDGVAHDRRRRRRRAPSLVRGADGAFSSGGDLDLVARDRRRLRTRGGASSTRRATSSTTSSPARRRSSRRSTGPAVGAGLAVGLLADVSIATPAARIVDGHTKLGVAAGDHAAIVWPLLCGLAKAKYHLLLCEPRRRRRGRADRARLAVRPRGRARGRARSRSRRGSPPGSQPRSRHTKLALNNWLRLAGPIVRRLARARVPRHDRPRRARGRRRRSRETPARLQAELA